jgi:hypothetical protein
MNEQIKMTDDEIETNNSFHKRRIDYLIKLGEVKLSEITNEKITEETYFNITELNTREIQFKEMLSHKYGKGFIDVSQGLYIRRFE